MSDDCVSTLPDIKQFDSVCDCDDCSDEREGFISIDSTDLSGIDSTNPSTTTTMFNKTVAAAIKSLISDISVDVTTTKVIKD